MTTATATDAPHTTTLADVRGLATLPIHSMTAPNAAGLLGLSRWHAYRLARAGELPVIRLGGRLLVPVPALRRLLGDLPPDASAPAP